MAIWFTGDTHFNHANIVEHSRRPFSCLEEMTETMATRWAGPSIQHQGHRGEL